MNSFYYPDLLDSTYFSFLAIISYLVAAIIGVIVTLIFSPFFESIATYIAAKTFLRFIFRRKKGIGGIWNHDWFVDSARFDSVNKSQNVKLKKIGNKVFAKYRVTAKDKKVYTYIMNGVIDGDNYITGKWYDLNAGNTYHGAFQLHINVNMDSMSGYWIGKSQDQKVKSGRWEWYRQ
jgi:hypothetical protein